MLGELAHYYVTTKVKKCWSKKKCNRVDIKTLNFSSYKKVNNGLDNPSFQNVILYNLKPLHIVLI